MLFFILLFLPWEKKWQVDLLNYEEHKNTETTHTQREDREDSRVSWKLESSGETCKYKKHAEKKLELPVVPFSFVLSLSSLKLYLLL